MLENFVQSGKVSLIIDGQFGSTGKGLIADAIVRENHIDICCATLSPNAGHTTYSDFRASHEKKIVTKLLPISGILSKRSMIYLSPESVIDVDILKHEVNTFNISEERVYIHPRASIVQTSEADYDEGLVRIGSTKKGTGPARASKLLRKNPLIGSINLGGVANVESLDMNYLLDQGCSVLIESGQGVDLGINYGLSYPYCTSRDVLPANLLADFGIHPKYLGNVILVMRTYPIRVGNPTDSNGIEIGYSGPFYDDSVELTWEELGQQPELTTVTQRIRRIATFSVKQFERTLSLVQPTHIFLNFVNYIREEDVGLFERLFSDRKEHILLGYGPRVEDITENLI